MVFGSKCTCFFLLQMVQLRNSAALTIKKNKIYTLMLLFFFIALQWIGDPLVGWNRVQHNYDSTDGLYWI